MKEVTLLEFVYVRFNDLQLTVVRGSFFLTFCRKFSEKIFFYRPVNNDKPNFVSFLVFFGAAASVIAKSIVVQDSTVDERTE